MSTTAVAVDHITIAQDIAQESCLRIPMTEQEQISQRQGIFAIASVVKEMCSYANVKEDIAKLILYAALVVEYAADFLAENPHKEMPEHFRWVLANTMILPLSRQSLTVLSGFRIKWNV